jgi:hypothetical protein
MRGPGERLKEVKAATKHPLSQLGTLWKFGRSQVAALFSTPEIPVHDASLRPDAHRLAKCVRDFGKAVQDVFFYLRKQALKNANGAANEETLVIGELIKREYLQERIADAACELYASSCTLSRLDSLLTTGNGNPAEVARDVKIARYFLTISARRVRQCLAALWDNDDADTTATADAVLERY